MEEPENPAMVNLAHMGSLQGVALPVMEFQVQGYKIRKIFAYKSTCPKEIEF